jgi:hypothetical protein
MARPIMSVDRRLKNGRFGTIDGIPPSGMVLLLFRFGFGRGFSVLGFRLGLG